MINKYIAEAIEAINRVTGLFYQRKTEEGYRELEGALIALNNMVSALSGEIRSSGERILDEERLNEILKQAMEALEAGDTILFSDIFEYDLKELLTQSIHAEN